MGASVLWHRRPVTPNSGKRCFTVSIMFNIVVMPQSRDYEPHRVPMSLQSSASRRYFARRSALPARAAVQASPCASRALVTPNGHSPWKLLTGCDARPVLRRTLP